MLSVVQNIYRVLVINPGSTSTKIGVFNNEVCIFEKTIRHHSTELTKYYRIIDQYDFRKKVILDHLDYEGINISKLDAVCARGGLVRPIEGGTYVVNGSMLEDLKIGYNGNHASNLGGIIAYEIHSHLNLPDSIMQQTLAD